MRARDAAFVFIALLLWTGTVFGADSIFLVSRKDMPDPNFRDTVVLVTRIEGATVGVILNRPSRLALSAVLPDLGKNVRPAEQLYVGGPVARQFVTFLFKADKAPDDATEVADGVFFASSRQLLQDILSGETRVESLRVFAGYAGWASGQLEAEVERGDWNVLRPDARTIFDTAPGKLWDEMHRRASRTPIRLYQGATSPSPSMRPSL